MKICVTLYVILVSNAIAAERFPGSDHDIDALPDDYSIISHENQFCSYEINDSCSRPKIGDTFGVPFDHVNDPVSDCSPSAYRFADHRCSQFQLGEWLYELDGYDARAVKITIPPRPGLGSPGGLGAWRKMMRELIDAIETFRKEAANNGWCDEDGGDELFVLGEESRAGSDQKLKIDRSVAQRHDMIGCFYKKPEVRRLAMGVRRKVKTTVDPWRWSSFLRFATPVFSEGRDGVTTWTPDDRPRLVEIDEIDGVRDWIYDPSKLPEVIELNFDDMTDPVLSDWVDILLRNLVSEIISQNRSIARSQTNGSWWSLFPEQEIFPSDEVLQSTKDLRPYVVSVDIEKLEIVLLLSRRRIMRKPRGFVIDWLGHPPTVTKSGRFIRPKKDEDFKYSLYVQVSNLDVDQNRMNDDHYRKDLVISGKTSLRWMSLPHCSPDEHDEILCDFDLMARNVSIDRLGLDSLLRCLEETMKTMIMNKTNSTNTPLLDSCVLTDAGAADAYASFDIFEGFQVQTRDLIVIFSNLAIFAVNSVGVSEMPADPMGQIGSGLLLKSYCYSLETKGLKEVTIGDATVHVDQRPLPKEKSRIKEHRETLTEAEPSVSIELHDPMDAILWIPYFIFLFLVGVVLYWVMKSKTPTETPSRRIPENPRFRSRRTTTTMERSRLRHRRIRQNRELSLADDGGVFSNGKENKVNQNEREIDDLRDSITRAIISKAEESYRILKAFCFGVNVFQYLFKLFIFILKYSWKLARLLCGVLCTFINLLSITFNKIKYNKLEKVPTTSRENSLYESPAPIKSVTDDDDDDDDSDEDVDIVCRNCNLREIVPRSFHTCFKCINDERWTQSWMYYCSKECCKFDWRHRHKIEHVQNEIKC